MRLCINNRISTHLRNALLALYPNSLYPEPFIPNIKDLQFITRLANARQSYLPVVDKVKLTFHADALNA